MHAGVLHTLLLWAITCTYDDQQAAKKAKKLLANAFLCCCWQVFCMHSEPNWSLPWQRKRQYSSSGSGFIIEGRRILTNAHCIEHGTQATSAAAS